MSEFESISDFPDPKFIFQWSTDSKHGLCCGIFGCLDKRLVKCKNCNSSYCTIHISWHIDFPGNIGIIVKNG